MPLQLKVYNEFDELLLHVEHVQGDSSPLRIYEGTANLRHAVKSLEGYDFERSAIVAGELRQFSAKWDSPDFLAALGGYWSSNFGWRTKLTETAPSFTFVMPPDIGTSNIMLSSLYRQNPAMPLERLPLLEVGRVSGAYAEALIRGEMAHWIPEKIVSPSEHFITFNEIDVRANRLDILSLIPPSLCIDASSYVTNDWYELSSEPTFGVCEQFVIAEVSEGLWAEKPSLQRLPLQEAVA